MRPVASVGMLSRIGSRVDLRKLGELLARDGRCIDMLRQAFYVHGRRPTATDYTGIEGLSLRRGPP